MNEIKYTTAPETVSITADAFGDSNKTTIYWLGGSGFLINARGTILMIDPILKTRKGAPNISEIEPEFPGVEYKMKVSYPIDSIDVPKLDGLLYTHSDVDHLAFGTARDLIALNPTIVGPVPVYQKLIEDGIDPKSMILCRSKDEIQLDNVLIEVTPADHPWQLLDVEKFGKPFRADDCVGFIINTPDGRFYLPGDTRLMEEHLTIQNIDVLALDASVDTYHLNHYGSTALAKSMSNALLLPYHYGTYDIPGHLAHCGDPMDVINQLENGSERGRIYGPGQALSLKDGKEIK